MHTLLIILSSFTSTFFLSIIFTPSSFIHILNNVVVDFYEFQLEARMSY